MASPDETVREEIKTEEELLFEQGLKEMYIDEALFEKETPKAAEEAPAEAEAPAPWPAVGPQEPVAPEVPTIEEEAPPQAVPAAAAEEAPAPMEARVPAEAGEAQEGPLESGEYLGVGSDLNGYFEEKDESLDFTEEDLEGLPLFDDMDEDPLETITKGARKPPPEAAPPPPMESQEPTAPAPQEPVAAPEQTPLQMPDWISRIDLKKAAMIIGAAAALLLIMVVMISLFSSDETVGPGEDPRSGYGDAVRGEGDRPPAYREGEYYDPRPIREGERTYERAPVRDPYYERSTYPERPPETVRSTQGPVEAKTRTDPISVEDLADNHHALGMALFKAGRFSDAIAEFENDITSSTLFLARCYQLLGENEEALKNYQRVLWEYPDRNAFIEVFALAEEMFNAGEFLTARKLYYAFISQMDRMPGPVKSMVPKAYFKIGRCLEEEAFAILDGMPIDPPPVVKEKVGDDERPRTAGILTSASDPGGKGGMDSWRMSAVSRLNIQSRRQDDFLTSFTVECICVPALKVFHELANKAGRSLKITEELEERLNAEVVSAFLKDKTLDEVLEYISGQVGFTYDLDEQNLVVHSLEASVDGDWLAMKNKAVETFQRSLYRFIGHEDAPKVYFEISKLHYLSGDYDSAITPANTLIVDYPDFSQLPTALLNISKCLMELGDFKKAREHLRSLVNKHTNHPTAQEGFILLARCSWKEGNPAEAILRIRAMQERFPDSPLIHQGEAVLARIFCAQGDFAAAVKLLESISIHEVEDPETAITILLLKSEAYLKFGNPEAAARAAVAMLDTWQDSDREQEALFLLADAYTTMGEDVLAFATCKTLKEKYPSTRSNPYLYITAAECLRNMDLHEDALQWLEEGVESCVKGTKDTYKMYMVLGNVLFEMKKYERAKVVFRKVRECRDYEKDASIRYVSAQMEQKDYRDALETLVDLLRHAKSDPPYESRLFKMAGDCYMELNDMEAAIKAYKGELK